MRIRYFRAISFLLRFDQLNPATGIDAPWMARAPGDARKTIMRARSSGATHREGSAAGIERRFSGVSMMVGSTQFTLMWCSRNSAAIASVSRITTALDAEYAPMFAAPLSAAAAATLTILPPQLDSMCGT